MSDYPFPDHMTHEQVADIFMTTMASAYTTREEFLRRLHIQFPGEAELNAFLRGKRMEANAVIAEAIAKAKAAKDGATYTLLADGKAIRCERAGCGKTSWNVLDVATKYCGFCRRFHVK